MTVACVPTRGVWGHAPSPQEFRSSQIAIRNKIIACDKTIITMLNFKISGGKGGFQGPPPPLLYETLSLLGLESQIFVAITWFSPPSSGLVPRPHPLSRRWGLGMRLPSSGSNKQIAMFSWLCTPFSLVESICLNLSHYPETVCTEQHIHQLVFSILTRFSFCITLL